MSAAACGQPDISTSADPEHPFLGCWDNAEGTSREGWTMDPSGWLIGYSANRNAEGEVTFFEHMRVERGAGSDVFIATGQDGSQTAFKRVDTENSNIFRFENPDHDFPQVITYEPSPGRLDAWISLMDGTNRIDFKKSACQN